MTIAQIAEQVVKESQAVQIRYRKDSYKDTGTAEYDCKPLFTGKSRGWIAFDGMTAKAVSLCYNALQPENQAKFNNLPLGKLVDFCWKHVR